MFLIIFAISLFSFSSFLTVHSVHQQPKHCVNCQYFLLKNNNPFNWNLETDLNYGKCSLFPKKDIEKQTKGMLISELVSGERDETINNLDFNYCTTARSFDNMCGQEGRFYKTKKLSKKQKCFFKVRKMVNTYFEED
jgi:hypothetical protein